MADIHDEIIDDAAIDAEVAPYIATDEEIRVKIAGYERQYGMTSAEFAEKWERDEAPDTFETNTWAMLLKYLVGHDAD